jgi:hypothetical protein
MDSWYWKVKMDDLGVQYPHDLGNLQMYILWGLNQQQ